MAIIPAAVYNRASMMPEMFRIFSRPVSGYAFFYVLGIVAGALLILRLSRREKLDTVEVAAFLILGICCGLLGSRVLAPLLAQLALLPAARFSQEAFRRDMASGGSFFGAILAALLYAVLYTRAFFKENRLPLLDVTVIGIALGHSIGRLGCFAAGCCYGIPTALPWGVSFATQGSHPHPMAGVPLHPVQVYEAALGFVNFAILYLLWKRRRFPGEIFSLYLVNYGLIRFATEFLRFHARAEMAWPGVLSWYQVLSLMLMAAGCLFGRRYKKNKSGGDIDIPFS